MRPQKTPEVLPVLALKEGIATHYCGPENRTLQRLRYIVLSPEAFARTTTFFCTQTCHLLFHSIMHHGCLRKNVMRHTYVHRLCIHAELTLNPFHHASCDFCNINCRCVGHCFSAQSCSPFCRKLRYMSPFPQNVRWMRHASDSLKSETSASSFAFARFGFFAGVCSRSSPVRSHSSSKVLPSPERRA